MWRLCLWHGAKKTALRLRFIAMVNAKVEADRRHIIAVIDAAADDLLSLASRSLDEPGRVGGS